MYVSLLKNADQKEVLVMLSFCHKPLDRLKCQHILRRNVIYQKMRALANLLQRIYISIFHNLIYSSNQFWKFWPVYDLPACFSGPRHNVQLLIKSGKTCKLWASIIIYLKYILVVDEIFFLKKEIPLL